MIASIAEINSKGQDILEGAGYDVRALHLNCASQAGLVAENQYFALAFQPFSMWSELVENAGVAELELCAGMSSASSSKVWDMYLLLACQEKLSTQDQYDQLVQLQYNTRRMRKMVMPGIGETLDRVELLFKPFLSITRLEVIAANRDPIRALADNLIAKGNPPDLVQRCVVLFEEGGRAVGGF
jgi:hypothetical protein